MSIFFIKEGDGWPWSQVSERYFRGRLERAIKFPAVTENRTLKFAVKESEDDLPVPTDIENDKTSTSIS